MNLVEYISSNFNVNTQIKKYELSDRNNRAFLDSLYLSINSDSNDEDAISNASNFVRFCIDNHQIMNIDKCNASIPWKVLNIISNESGSMVYEYNNKRWKYIIFGSDNDIKTTNNILENQLLFKTLNARVNEIHPMIDVKYVDILYQCFMDKIIPNHIVWINDTLYNLKDNKTLNVGIFKIIPSQPNMDLHSIESQIISFFDPNKYIFSVIDTNVVINEEMYLQLISKWNKDINKNVNDKRYNTTFNYIDRYIVIRINKSGKYSIIMETCKSWILNNLQY